MKRFLVLLFFPLTVMAADVYNSTAVKFEMESVKKLIKKLNDKKIEKEKEILKPKVKEFKEFEKKGIVKNGKKGIDKKKFLAENEYIYVFVSSSIPLETLKRYVHDAAQFPNDFTFVIRGVVGNNPSKIRPTLLWMRKVLQKNEDEIYNVEFQINPEAFIVDEVPAFALVRTDDFKKLKVEATVFGDVSIPGAVKKLYQITCKKSLEEMADKLHVNTGVCKPEKTARAGELYKVAEKNILDLIRERAAKVDKSLLVKELQKKAENWRPYNGVSLPVAKKNKRYSFVPIYTLDHDIPKVDKNGRIVGVLYPKGYSFNPLEYIRYMPTVIVFNGNNTKELDWIRKHADEFSNAVLCISDGTAFQVEKKLGKKVFYATKELVEKFRIRETISVARKDGKKIVVEVYKP